MIRQTTFALLLAMSMLVLVQVVQAQQATKTYTVFLPHLVRPAQAELRAEEQAVLDLINQARAEYGASIGRACPALSISPALEAAARAHSDDMAQRNFFSHTNPDGVSAFERVSATGYVGSRIAENIAAGYPTAAEAFEGWMDSQGHRANILDCSLTETGIGYSFEDNDQSNVRQSNGTSGGPYFVYWTEVFATP